MHKTRFALLATLFSFSAITLATAQQLPAVSQDMSDAEFADAGGGRLESTGGPNITILSHPTPNLWHARLERTGTGWTEEFLIQVPTGYAGQKRPVLVAAHQFSASVWDAFNNTTFFAEASQRGWFLIAPQGAHQYNFGIEYAQKNLEILLNYIGGTWLPYDPSFPQFDEEKIYGVGFSMGGGSIASHACRHLDPTSYPFAAIVIHTGTMSVAAEWSRLSKILSLIPMFGGSPWFNSFGYIIASSIHVLPGTSTPVPHSNLIRNVPELPIWLFYAVGDTHSNVELCDIFYEHTQNLGFRNVFFSTGPGANHRWNTLNETAACDFLGQHSTFKKPVGEVQIVADGDKRYYDIGVQPLVGRELSYFHYDNSRVLSENQLILTAISNVSSLSVHCADMGLNTSNRLTLQLGGANGSPATPTPTPLGVQLVWESPRPNRVTRNGVLLVHGVDYFCSAGMLSFTENNSSSNPVWLFR